jgi:glycosyltransferase involved in cell wall biosynthesis
MTLMDIVFGFVAFAWGNLAVSRLWHLRWARRLPSLTDLLRCRATKPTATPARVSAILPARDEAARIEGSIRRLLAQEGLDLELIVVNDRSQDGTQEILTRLAAEHPRLRVIHIDTLPDGWLGKCHACHVGATAASGDWLLFLDADSWMKPDVVQRALLAAEEAQAGHVTLAPGIAPERWSGQAWHLAFPLTVIDWMSRVNRDHPRAYVGMGAFNLVRADAYRACGGYEKLRLTVIDDMKLGLLLRRAGARTRAFFAGDDLQSHWGASAGEMIRLLEKNYFAAVEYRLWLAVPLTVGGFLVWLLALLGPFTGTTSGLLAGICLGAVCLPAAWQAHRLNWSPWLAPLALLIFPVFFWAMGNSVMATVRSGGVRWRGTFYSLDALRRGNLK